MSGLLHISREGTTGRTGVFFQPQMRQSGFPSVRTGVIYICMTCKRENSKTVSRLEKAMFQKRFAWTKNSVVCISLEWEKRRAAIPILSIYIESVWMEET